MEHKKSYHRISKGLSRLLRIKNRQHFNQKDLSFDTASRKRYFNLFNTVQKNIQKLDKQYGMLNY